MSIKKSVSSDAVASLKVHATDTGSSGVQIAALHEKIKALSSDHFSKHKKDHHSRLGLLKKVSRMRRLIKYMQRVQPTEYEKVKATLGLRK